MRLASPLHLRLSEGVSRVQVAGIEALAEAYRRFYRRQIRLLIAYRHVSVHDPPLMAYLCCRALLREARRSRRPLGGLGHAHFLYGRAVMQWAGGAAAWLIPRIAGLPVTNRRSDVRAMRLVREHLTAGRFPVALAPEGQVTYHNHLLGPVEGGIGRLALWCLDDLERMNRPERLLILPVGIHYRYGDNPEGSLPALLRRIAAQAGLPAPAGPPYDGLLALTDGLLERMEEFYARFYRLPQGSGTRTGEVEEAEPRSPAVLERRILRICNAALAVPEGFMKLQPLGTTLDRVFTVRQHSWDYLFRGDLEAKGPPCPLESVLADRLADETYLHQRHNELVDLLEYLRPDYISPDCSPNRLLEYALNLADLLNRLLGGNIGTRYSPPSKQARLIVGEPLDAGELLRAAKGSRGERAALITRTVAEGLVDLSRE